MLDQDALQDILSSLGPFRLDTILRRGLYTTSIKAYDLHSRHHWLFKLSTKPPLDPIFAVLPNHNNLFVTKRQWYARCLRERLNQFPYLTMAERLFIMEQVRGKVKWRVKVSNVMMTAWSFVVVVDEGDTGTCCCLLDDTDPAVSLEELQCILELDGNSKLNSDYLLALSLFKPHACFERAAYLSVHQITETIEDLVLMDDIVLCDLVVLLLIAVVKLSKMPSTRGIGWSLIMRLSSSDPVLQYHVIPTAMDLLSSSSTVLRVTSLSLLAKHGELVKKHRVKRAIKQDDQLLLGLYGLMFGDPQLACSIQCDTINEETVLSLIDHGLDIDTLLLLCSVLDQYEVDTIIVPLLDNNLHHWALLMLKGRVSVHRLVAECRVVPGLAQLAGRIPRYSISVANLEPTTPVPTATATVPPSFSDSDTEVGELLEPISTDTHTVPPTGTRLGQSMRFWCPTKKQLTISDNVVCVHANDQWVTLFTANSVHVYGHDGFPCKRAVWEYHGVDGVVGGTTNGDSVIMVAVDNTACVLYTVQINTNNTKEYKTVCGEYVSIHSLPDHTVALVTKNGVVVLSLDLTILYTVPVPGRVSQSDTSPNGAYLALLSHKMIMILDLRARLLVHSLALPDTVTAMCLHFDWSTRAEHLRPRAWLCYERRLCSVDLINGAVLKEYHIDSRCTAVLCSMGAHYIVYATKSAVHYYDYRKDRLVRFDISGVNRLVFVDGGVVAVSKSCAHLLY